MSHFWGGLEEIAGPAGVRATWSQWTGAEFEIVRAAFLRRASYRALAIPCRAGCGCEHDVVEHDDGTLVGVCTCDPWNCENIELKPEDVVVWELDWRKLGRAVARALGCEAKDGELGLPGTAQVAALGTVLPVVLTIQQDGDDFRGVIGQLIAQLRENFVVLAPTGRFMDAHCHGLLKSAKAGFFDLESNLTLLPSGLLQARRSGGELFSALLPDAPEEITEEAARKLYAQVLVCASEQTDRKAPIKQVFDLYCRMGFSAEAVGVKLHCSKATVINRLNTLHQRTGVTADKLRAYTPFFADIEKSIADPRAKRIRRKDAAQGDDPDGNGQE